MIRRLVLAAVALFAILLSATAAFAQQNPLHQQGLMGAIDGALPFEQVDPLSGNLVVSATDLVLPGNAGFDLRVQRFYNSAIYPGYATGDLTLPEDSWAGIGWRLHFGRILNPDATGSGQTLIEMADGSRQPLFTTTAFPEGWITPGLWRYNRTTHTLKLPNGIEYVFDRMVTINATIGDARYVTEIRDPFNNRITFQYFDASGPPDGVAQIHQILSPTQARDVTFTYDATLKSLKTMQYGDRIWTYDQDPAGPAGFSVLRVVHPPKGLPWQYDYSSSAPGQELSVIHAPLGGTVTYSYGDVPHRTGPITTTTRVVTSRTSGGREVPVGTWTFTYDAGSNHDETSVTTPSGITRYRFLGHGLAGDFSPWLAGALAERTTENGNGTVLEREVTDYIRSEPRSPDYVPGNEGLTSSDGVFVALPAQRTISRGSHSWTTAFDYHVGLGTFNDFGQPWTVTETGEATRTTTRTFINSFTPYIRGRLDTESVRVGQEIVPSSWTYDQATGFVTEQTIHSIQQRFSPHPDGNVATSTDALNHVTSYTYAWGRLRQIQTPHVTTEMNVDSDGTVTWVGVADQGTAYEYDAAFRLKKVTPRNTNPIIYDYDDVNGVYIAVSRGAATTWTRPDGFGRPIKTMDPAGVSGRTEYDAAGRTIFVYAPFTSGSGSRGTLTIYDPLNRPVTVTEPGGSITSFSYDGIDVSVTDAANRTTTYDYSAFGAPTSERLTAVTDAAGQTTHYSYEVLNNLTRVEVPGVPARTWVFDGRGLLLNDTQPESGTTIYEHDSTGNRTKITTAVGDVTILTYDDSQRLTGVDVAGTADDTTITFDTYGRLYSTAASGTTTTFAYDTAGRVASRTDVTAGHSWVSQYGYDMNDNLTSVTYPSGRVIGYGYDTANRLTTVKNNGADFATQFTYGETGVLASYKTGVVVQALEYDNRDRLHRLTATPPAGAALDLTYAYDNASQLTGITDPRANASQHFTYDGVNRIATADGPWGSTAWTYDFAGNRLSETTGAVTTYTYNPATQRLMSMTGGATDSFGYDDVGRLISDSRGSYGYSPRGQLATVTGPSMSATYGYDAAGSRIARTVNGVTTYTVRSADQQPLSEYQLTCGSLAWTRDTVYAGGLVLGAVKANVSQPVVAFVTGSANIGEGQSNPTASVQITTPGGAATTCPVTVSYGAVAGTASTADFTATQGTLTFTSGTASGAVQTIPLGIVNDGLDEDNETFTLNLSSAIGATIGGMASETVTITDDDAPPALTISDASVQEGNSGTIAATFTVTLSNLSGRTVQATYGTSSDTATAGSDFATTTGTVTIAAGSSSAVISVLVTGDTLPEPWERFIVTLSSPTNATLADAQGIGTIRDDDVAPRSSLRAFSDYDGDGRSDLGVFRPGGTPTNWFVRLSATTFNSSLTGFWGDGTYDPAFVPVPGDYDGDGKTDLAVWSPAHGDWFIARSSTGYEQSWTIFWGDPGYNGDFVPVPADYDGDGITDIAVWARNTGEWFVLTSSSQFTNGLPTQTWGAPGVGQSWVPVPGDYDGDGRADFAVWSSVTGHWLILKSSTNNAQYVDILWGNPSYDSAFVPVPGDIDGDGRVDPAVWSPQYGTWFALQSTSNYTSSLTRAWGNASAGPWTPVVLDLDGDGLADFGVWQRSTGTWWILTSSNQFDPAQGFTYTPWGITGDVPLPKAFRQN